jgi:hypothetical protein
VELYGHIQHTLYFQFLLSSSSTWKIVCCCYWTLYINIMIIIVIIDISLPCSYVFILLFRSQLNTSTLFPYSKISCKIDGNKYLSACYVSRKLTKLAIRCEPDIWY